MTILTLLSEYERCALTEQQEGRSEAVEMRFLRAVSGYRHRRNEDIGEDISKIRIEFHQVEQCF
jgi:hypothetical protein